MQEKYIPNFFEWVEQNQKLQEGTWIQESIDPIYLDTFQQNCQAFLNENKLKDFWQKYKKTLTYGALGAGAIASLLLSGIPFQNLLPYIGLGVTQQAISQAMHDITSSGQKPSLPNVNEKPLKIVTDDRGIYTEDPQGKLQQISPQDLAKTVAPLAGSGREIIVHRTGDSRPSVENAVSKILNQSVGEKGWEFSNNLLPPLNPPTQWNPQL